MENIRRIHPGVFIKDLLESYKMTSKELSIRTGISERTLSAIINENGRITFDVAYKLSLFFDTSINYWVILQAQYDMFIVMQSKQKEIDEDWKLVKPIKPYLLDFGYISSDDTKEEVVNKCRKVCGVNNLTLLKEKDTFVNLKEQHNEIDNDCFSQNFWISLALNEARKKNGIPYDKKKLNESIPVIRKMTRKDPKDFLPRLEKILSNCGISFVLLPYLPKSNLYGATKWFSKDNVMLAISNRGAKADLFWFSLFHEISHVLMEHRREMLLNSEGNEDDEADVMAANMLIPEKKWKEFIDKEKEPSYENIVMFADDIGVLPCIVLGRLNKEKIIPYGKYSRLLNVSYTIKMVNGTIKG